MSIEFPLSASLTRRAALVGGVSAAAAAFAGPARAAGGILVVSNWGGDWNDRTVRFVEQPLVEAKGIKIVRDLGMEPERKAKLVAERQLRRGSVDVIHINATDAFELQNQGVLADLDGSKIQNLANVVPTLKQTYFVPWLYSGVVILYNKDKIKDPPKSYADLWDKKWAGKLGLTNQLYFNYVMMAGLLNGGSMTNAEEGQKRLAELKELTKPRIFAAHQQMAAGLATGEVELAVNYKARALQWQNDGTPLLVQYPSEGAIATTFGASLPKRAPNPDAAYEYFNDMLDPKAMAQLSGASFYAPANTKADLTPELRAKVDFTEDQRKALKFPDYGYVAKNTAAWLEWWNKSIAS
ncbi:MAG: extracellular solute-binding protein [Methylobacteriaceae bacterium]|nr:extracellular solute-binding protein [Methylobacteriaceae bacterium]